MDRLDTIIDQYLAWIAFASTINTYINISGLIFLRLFPI